MELFAADGHDAGGCERVTGKSGMRPYQSPCKRNPTGEHVAISERTKRLLWSRSGGYCQNPTCNRELFEFFENGAVVSLGELAHVIGQSARGPRGQCRLAMEERDEYQNIILLCPTCHTLADKSPEQFPAKTLHEWKRCHEEKIQHSFVVPMYATRDSLSAVVHRLLRRNRAVFRQYGPHSEHSTNPLSDAAEAWRRLVLSDVIPNNRRVADLLNANEHLLSESERTVLDKFLLHQQAFEYNHLSGDKTSAAPTFPDEMDTILLGRA